MTTYVFDTNIISLLLRDDVVVTNRYRRALLANDLIVGCPVVWYEVERGLLTRDARKQSGRFTAFFATFIWQDYIREDWTLAADLWTQRRNQGLPISDADLLIGVFARNRNATRITDNEKDFANLGVTVENWTLLQQ